MEMESFPKLPPKTIIEVFKLLPEGTWVEIIDGAITMLPSFNSTHQIIVGNLLLQLSRVVEDENLGEVMPIIDVYLDEDSNIVLPDITFVNKDNHSIIQDHIHGTPDLLVEVLSPSNPNHDLVKKKDLYERFGVKEYWIVDPETKLALVFELSRGLYVQASESIGSLKSSLLKRTFHF
jgi:Uma2 family endonuclease